MFNCEHCKYSTKCKSNYNRHLKSKKHKNKISLNKLTVLQNKKVNESTKSNVSKYVRICPNRSKSSLSKSAITCEIIWEKIYSIAKKDNKLDTNECIYCGLAFSQAGSLAKHQKSCQLKKIFDNVYNIKETQKKYESIISNYIDKNKSLEQDVAFYKKTLNDSKVIVKGNMSAFAFINKNYTKTPVLTKPNFKLLKGFKEIGDHGQPKFIEDMVYKFKNKIAHEEVGDIICDYYKKDDPKLQSLWVTDPSRNSYVIRSKVNDNTLWVKDRGGNDSRQLTIDPVIVKLKKQLINYQKTLQKEISKESNERKMSLDTIIEHLKKSSDFIEEIKKNEFQKKVLDYLSPKLSIDTTNNDKLLEEK